MLEYARFYQSYISNKWDNMTPLEYGYLLVTIAVIGYLAMKSGAR